MGNQKCTAQLRYLKELARNLQRAGFDVTTLENEETLLISREGVYLCRVNGEGTVFFKQEVVDALNAQAELDRVVGIANTTGEYMAMMEYTPSLKAQGLTGDYRILADFGGAVLAAHPTECGAQFVVWDWDFDRKGVHHGGYYQECYEAAKRDFVTRSGLIPHYRLFSDAQLVEIYRCCADTLEGDYEITETQRETIHDICEQIECCLPDIGERIREQNIEAKQTM